MSDEQEELTEAWVAFSIGGPVPCPREPFGHLALGTAQQPSTYHFRCSACGWLSGWFHVDEDGQLVRSESNAPTAESTWPPEE